MTKYLFLWEVDRTRMPDDPKERAAGWTAMTNMVKQDMADGFTKDHGIFPCELKGYSIFEGSELEAMILTQKYAPWIIFKIHPVATIEQTEKVFEVMSQ
jgi:hypothetical protein